MENRSIVNVDEFLEAGPLQQALDLADKFFKAQCFGADVKNPAQAFVKIQAGREMGMAPMEAMNSLYIVNGKVTIWGMALSKRLREFGWKIDYKEELKSCTAIIAKEGERYEYTATEEEILRLNSQAYKRSPKDKLRWHALSRLVRFYVPEVLGPVSYLREEIDETDLRDTPAEVKDVSEIAERREALLKAIAEAKGIEDLQAVASQFSLTMGLTEQDKVELKEAFRAKKAEIEKPKLPEKPVQVKKAEKPVKVESAEVPEFPFDNQKSND